MRAALHEGPGTDLRVVDDVEIEAPRSGEVRVRVSHCGVCHSDLHVLDGAMPSPTPVILGHEAAGVVEEVGEGVEALVPGDKVILTLQPQCGRCPFCARGEVHLCVTGTSLATGALPDGGTRLSRGGETVYRGVGLGGFAEQVIAPVSAAIKVPEDTPLEVACLLGCAVQTGVGAVLNTARVPEGATVVVIGLGGVGIATVQGARLAGAARIIGVDTVAGRRDRSEAFGVTDVVDPASDDLVELARSLTGGFGVDHAFDTVATSTTMTSCVKALRSAGQLTVLGVPGPDAAIELPMVAWALAEKTVTGSFLGSSNPHREFPRLLALWRAGRLDLEGMVSNTRPLEELPEAFADMQAGEGLRTVIDLGAP